MQKEISKEKLYEYARNGTQIKDIVEETHIDYMTIKKQLINSGLEDMRFNNCMESKRKKLREAAKKAKEKKSKIICNTCKYRESKPGCGLCNYILIVGHSANCGEKNNYARYEKDSKTTIRMKRGV